jgi:hypothetical protein
MLTVEELNARAEALGQDPLLRQLAGTVRSRVERILREDPPVPVRKALLSRSGGVCPHDGGSLVFDPWQPSQHRCSRCGRVATGERHDGHWARAGHLWVAERIADLSTLAALEGDEAAAARARDLIVRTAAVYAELPNRDNVLGPTHLFFSTYLESIWITNWIAGAFLLRQADHMDDETAAAVDAVAEEAATIIGEFNEGLSNRQTWNSAALTAIGAWFGDEELAQNAIESRTGLLGHLTDGFAGAEATWWEGENYHLFAARGLTVGMSWARLLGFDLLADDELRQHYRQAMLAPSLSALPDLTYPARKDSRYGVSLAEPAYLETWEVARAWLEAEPQTDAWLAALYATTPRPAEQYDAWLHNAGFPLPSARGRGDLSWWSLLALDSRELDVSEPLGQPSVLLPSQGLGILRHGDRYTSLECGAAGGGHGHPDRLHLTLHARGVHWLPDMGTGSYVDPSLFWYRSARAHNAPTVDGESPRDARCVAFESAGAWGWIRGSAGPVTRSIVAGPDVIVDLLEIAPGSGAVELPWHLQGKFTVATSGTWEAAELDDPSLGAERFVPAVSGPVIVDVEANGQAIRLHLFGGELVQATGPGLPGSTSRQPFLLRRVRDSAWIGAVIDLDPAASGVVEWGAGGASVSRSSGRVEVTITPTRASVTDPAGKVTLTGLREVRPAPKPLIAERPPWEARAMVPHAWAVPALDATFEGFDLSHPLTLDDEHQYRRSEEPYDGQRFAATAWLNWDHDGVYLAVDVRKPELVLRAQGAAPLDLDNEADDIHQDGLQLYLKYPDETTLGFVVVPDETGALRARSVGAAAGASVEGAWAASDEGYVVTLALRDPRISTLRPGDVLKFDLVINEMTSDRVRRLGQLVWSGDGGWTYLWGDRGEAAGVIELG